MVFSSDQKHKIIKDKKKTEMITDWRGLKLKNVLWDPGEDPGIEKDINGKTGVI